METEAGEISAEQRARAKLGLINHVAIYFVIMTTLAMVNLATNRRVLWFLWPAIGWGIVVVLHALRVFVISPSARLYGRLLEHEKRRRA